MHEKHELTPNGFMKRLRYIVAASSFVLAFAGIVLEFWLGLVAKAIPLTMYVMLFGIALGARFPVWTYLRRLK